LGGWIVKNRKGIYVGSYLGSKKEGQLNMGELER